MAKVYHVAPRYTPGSPALVDESTATRVAREERGAYERIVSGRYYATAAEIEHATRCGLAGIVEERHVRARSVAFVDLITGERGERRAGAG